LRVFQLDTGVVKVDHCSLAEVAFTIEETGQFKLNFRADQNPWFTKEVRGLPPPTEHLKLETTFLKRNEFHVRVRCHGYYPVREEMKTTGKPALVVLEPPPFWVQRGVPYMGFIQGVNAGLGQYFNLIERVEIDFYYR
jgi:hypothetical protein